MAVLASGRALAFARRVPLVAIAVAGLVTGLLVWAKTLPAGTFLANFIRVTGPYSETLFGPLPVVYPLPWWVVLEVASAVGVALITLVALSSLAVAGRRVAGLVRGTRPDADVTTPAHRTAVLLGLDGAMVLLVTTAVSVVTDAPIFDRYLLAALPGIAGALAYAARGTRWRTVAGRWIAGATAVATLALVTLGLSLSDTAATFDGAKWRLASAVEAAGHPAHEIDGGYEWWGFHNPAPITGRGFGGQYGESLWIKLFADARACVRSEYSSPAAETAGIVAEVRATTWHGFTYHLVAVPQEGTHYCPAP